MQRRQTPSACSGGGGLQRRGAVAADCGGGELQLRVATAANCSGGGKLQWWRTAAAPDCSCSGGELQRRRSAAACDSCVRWRRTVVADCGGVRWR
jgi:hypothetical protein